MRGFKILHRFISEGYVSCESAVHRPHEHERLIIHGHDRVQKIPIPSARHHIPNILTHKRSTLGMPARRPSLSQMIRQFLSGIITHYLLGKRQFPIEMVLKRILRRLPRRRTSPRQNFLSRPTETRPRRRHIRSPRPILGPILIITTRLIRIRRHIPPRNGRTANTAVEPNGFGIVELRQPLQRGPRLSSRHTPHTTPRNPRITVGPP